MLRKTLLRNVGVSIILLIILNLFSIVSFVSAESVVFDEKWEYSTGINTYVGPLAVDIDNNGIYEVFISGMINSTHGKIVCLNGSDGTLLWEYRALGISIHSPMEIDDLDNDGTYEMVVSAGKQTISLNCEDGSEFWVTPYESDSAHLAIADIDRNGYPYVYICSGDDKRGLAGSGRIRKLRGIDGFVVAEHFCWRPVYGGISIGDIQGDGSIEVFLTDRGKNFGDAGYGKGIQCFDDELNLLWYHDEVTCSSHNVALIDVNYDDILDIVALQLNSEGNLSGGIYVINGSSGGKMSGKYGDDLGIRVQSQPAIYDFDHDGNIELLTCRNSSIKIWDLTAWSLEKTLPGSYAGSPRLSNVVGDDDLEIVTSVGDDGFVRIFDNTYAEVYRLEITAIGSNLVQDIDGDGFNEIVFILSSGIVKAFDLGATAANRLVRSDSLYYSERNLGVSVYIPPPAGKQYGGKDGSSRSQPMLTFYSGPEKGDQGVVYNFTIAARDDDNDTLRYSFDWGDGFSDNSEFLPNEDKYVITHQWNEAGRFVITANITDNQSFTTNEYTILIDAIDVFGLGYLFDTDNDETYDIFYNNNSGEETEVELQESLYLIDLEGDGSWDYLYDAESNQLTNYQQPFDVFLYAGIILMVLIVLLLVVALIRRRGR